MKISEGQILAALQQVKYGIPVIDVCNNIGVSEKNFYYWCKKYCGMSAEEICMIKENEKRIRKSRNFYKRIVEEGYVYSTLISAN